MTKIIIELETEKSALYLKNEIEKIFPLIEGKVKVQKPAEIKPLSEVIRDIRSK